MYYPDSVIEDVRSGNDIVRVIGSYVQLKQKGTQYFGLCPFHKEKTASFSVSPDKQMYYCFSCGAGGNVYTFLMQMENINFPDAIKKLAEEINYTLPETDYSEELKRSKEEKERLIEINKVVARYFYDNLTENPNNEASDYINKRGISRKMRIKFGLGYSLPRSDALLKEMTAKGHSNEDLLKLGLVIAGKSGGYFDRFQGRLMFPIFDYWGNVVGFGGRILEKGEPKYLNSPDTVLFDKSKNLYGINYARKNRSREIILVEGYMDVIALFEAGFENAVAALGTAFNGEHAKLLKRFCDNVIILFDSDAAGIKATLRAIPILLANGLNVKILQLENAKDPDEYIKAHGREQFAKALKNTVSHITFRVNCLKQQYNLENIGEKVFFTQEVAKLLSSLNNAIERDAYIKEVAKLTDISAIAIKKETEKQDLLLFDNQANLKPLPTLHSTAKERAESQAKKRLLLLLSKNHTVFEKLKPLLTEEDFGEGVFSKLFTVINQFYDTNRRLFPADILNYFDSGDEQNTVSEIFATKYIEPEKESLEKEINDLVKKIKRDATEKKLSTVTDAKELQNLIETKKNIEKIHIKLF